MKKTRNRILCGLLAAVIAVSGWNPGTEVRTFAAGSYQSAIDKAKQEKEALEKKKQEMADKIAALQSDKKSPEEYIKKVDEELSNAYLEMTALEESIAACDKNLRETEIELSEAIETKNNQYATMKARIKYMYVNGETSFWEIFTGANSLEDLLNQVEYRAQIAAYDDSL